MSEGTSKSRFEHNCTRYNTGKSNSRDFISKLIVEIVEEYAEDNLSDYVERTINPRVLKYRHWIRRIRQMNIYLSQIAGPTKKYSDKRIIRNVITSSIPSSWKKIKLKEEHRKDNLVDVLRILETFEDFGSPQQKI